MLKNKVKWRVEAQFKNIKNFDEEPFLLWDTKADVLEVSYFETEDVERWINESPEIKEIVRDALQSIYRYAGPFQFSGGIPF